MQILPTLTTSLAYLSLLVSALPQPINVSNAPEGTALIFPRDKGDKLCRFEFTRDSFTMGGVLTTQEKQANIFYEIYDKDNKLAAKGKFDNDKIETIDEDSVRKATIAKKVLKGNIKKGDIRLFWDRDAESTVQFEYLDYRWDENDKGEGHESKVVNGAPVPANIMERRFSKKITTFCPC